MITLSELTVSGLRTRVVNVPLERPVQTSAGEIPTVPLVLIGRPYVRLVRKLRDDRRELRGVGDNGESLHQAGLCQLKTPQSEVKESSRLSRGIVRFQPQLARPLTSRHVWKRATIS